MSTTEYQQRMEITPGQLVERLVQYDGPPEAFLIQLLAVQCHIGNAEAGAIVRPAAGREGTDPSHMEVLSLYPPLEEGNTTPPAWLLQARELAPKILASKKTQVVPVRTTEEMYGVAASRYIALFPIWGKQGVRGVSAFLLPNIGPTEVENSRNRLELTITLLSLYELRLTLQRRKTDLTRLRQALQVLSESNDQKKYRGMAMAVCNHVAASFGAERVGVGLLKGRYVKLQGLSHTEKFTRKMEAVQVIEAAMEESLDQDSEIVYPAPEGTEIVNRAAKELSQRHGHSNVLVLPLRRADEPVGALCIERPGDKPFTLDDAETLRVTCDLVTPRLFELSENDRWFGAKWAASSRKGLATLVGPTHTWVKTLLITLILVMLFATFVKGTYKVKAPFTVEASQKYIVSAPFDGFLIEARMLPGDKVVAHETVIARLDTFELVQQKLQFDAERKGAEIEAGDHATKGKIEESAQARQRAAFFQAKIEEIDLKLKRADITSPISGEIGVGDETREQNRSVQRGEVLFEVIPTNRHAELTVNEDQISDVEVGQEGYLAALASPGHYIRFTVERIDPVAESDEQRNMFRIRARLHEVPAWFKPGMEGVAKIEVGPRPYGKIWSRELINWIRMKLWV